MNRLNANVKVNDSQRLYNLLKTYHLYSEPFEQGFNVYENCQNSAKSDFFLNTQLNHSATFAFWLVSIGLLFQ